MWQHGILMKVNEIGIKGELAQYIQEFLTERRIAVRIKNAQSQQYHMPTEVPQGSVMSPILFDIMMDDIFSQCPAEIQYSIYADDGAMWLRCTKIEEGLEIMQKAVDSVGDWSKRWGLKISGDKTKCVIFTKKRVKQPRQIHIGLEKIEFVKSVKFLGTYLDRGLTWIEHISILKEKCQSRLRLLKYISGYRWGSSADKLLVLYKSLILSKLDYGSFLYGTAAESHLIKIDRIQYAAARMITGALKPTPTKFLEVEVNLMPLRLRRSYLGMKYISKVVHIKDHPTGQEYIDHYNFQFYKLRPHSLPFYGRMLEESKGLNIDFTEIKVLRMEDYLGIGIDNCLMSLKSIEKMK